MVAWGMWDVWWTHRQLAACPHVWKILELMPSVYSNQLTGVALRRWIYCATCGEPALIQPP